MPIPLSRQTSDASAIIFSTSAPSTLVEDTLTPQEIQQREKESGGKSGIGFFIYSEIVNF